MLFLPLTVTESLGGWWGTKRDVSDIRTLKDLGRAYFHLPESYREYVGTQ